MQARAISVAVLIALTSAGALAQEGGLRFPSRTGVGIDPAFAPGWLSSAHERFGYAQYQWRDAIGFAPSQRLQWAYSFGERGSLGMSYTGAREFDPVAAYAQERQFGLFGRFQFAPDWSLSAHASAREPGNLLRLQDFRIGVRRQF
jgi:hypothetical protein